MQGNAESDADRVIVIERVIDAPARLLFECYAKPEHFKRWFGPQPYPLTLCEIDFRVGGRCRFAMTGPDGVQMTPFSGAYLEIVPHKKISWWHAFEEPGAERMILTVTFDEKDGTTRLVVHTEFATAQMKREHTERGFIDGTNIGLDQLERVVKELA